MRAAAGLSAAAVRVRCSGEGAHDLVDHPADVTLSNMTPSARGSENPLSLRSIR
jgi:hypothetical protein